MTLALTAAIKQVETLREKIGIEEASLSDLIEIKSQKKSQLSS